MMQSISEINKNDFLIFVFLPCTFFLLLSLPNNELWYIELDFYLHDAHAIIIAFSSVKFNDEGVLKSAFHTGHKMEGAYSRDNDVTGQ